MKTRITIYTLAIAISFGCGYWVRSQVHLSSGVSLNSWMITHNYSQKIFIKDIEDANDLVEAWRIENYNDLDPDSSIAVIPNGEDGVAIRWTGLSSKQRDVVEKIVYGYLNEVVQENIKKQTEQAASSDR